MRHEMLEQAMESLNEREKHILTERRLTDEPQTLEELSQVYDVSRERRPRHGLRGDRRRRMASSARMTASTARRSSRRWSATRQWRRASAAARTISQQTAKNVFLWQGGGYFRKGLGSLVHAC